MSTVTPKAKALMNLPQQIARGKEMNHQYHASDEVFPTTTHGGFTFIRDGAFSFSDPPNILNNIDVGSSTIDRVGRMIKLQRYHFRMTMYTNVELNNCAIRSMIVFDKKPQSQLPLLSEVLQRGEAEAGIVALPREINVERFEILYDKTITLNGNNQLRANKRDPSAAAWDISFNQDAASSSHTVYEVIDLSAARFYTLYKSATPTGGEGDVDYGQLLSFQWCDVNGVGPNAATRLPYKVAYGELQWTDK